MTYRVEYDTGRYFKYVVFRGDERVDWTSSLWGAKRAIRKDRRTRNRLAKLNGNYLVHEEPILRGEAHG